jgi:hypothetical protein
MEDIQRMLGIVLLAIGVILVAIGIAIGWLLGKKFAR